LAIDEAERHGLATPEPSPSLKAALREMLPAHCAAGNPVDLTGDVIGDAGLYKKVMDAARSEYDYQMVIFGDPIPGASRVVTPGAAELVVFLGGAEVEREEREKLYDLGVPVFPTPERGVKALAQFLRFVPTPVTALPEPVLPRTSGLRLLPAGEAAKLLTEAGIPVAAAPLAASPEEAVNLAEQFGYPVALKVASPDLPHKTDVGGVQLYLMNAEEVRTAYQEIMASVRLREREARVDGVTVSLMAPPGGLEVILGAVTDPQYGPTLMFGLGGIYTEIYRDVGFCLLPAADEELDRLIAGLKGYPLLTGFRGQPKRDLAALKQAMKALSIFAQKHPELDQIEINPLLLYDKGLFGVDARILSRI
jgi:acetyltransferase